MTNPLLSFWLSCAEAQRQQARVIHEVGEHVIRFWSGAWVFPARRRRRRARVRGTVADGLGCGTVR
jgi:hypothetical protein